MDNSPEDISLAVEIIRQLENLEYPEESILQAMIYICQDTLKKLPEGDHREIWRQKLACAFQRQIGSDRSLN